MAEPHNPRNGWRVALPVIGLTSLFVVFPFLHYGIPSGHDFEFHVNSWIDVVDHWKQGIVYPHWESMAHYGYGEARFIFYPPLSWTLGALLGLVLPWKLVPAAYIWTVMTLCGCSMFMLSSRYLPRSAAIWAAAFYAANPYHLVVIYWRSAFAELLAAAWLPLLLLLLLELDERSSRVIAPLGLVLAAGWLTNLPSAVMMNYSLAVLALCLAVLRKSWTVIAYAAAACALGAGLGGFYLLPAFHEQGWVNIGQVLAPGVSPQENFLFAFTDDPDHNRFNMLVSIVAVFEILAAAVLLFVGRRSDERKLWPLMLAWSAVTTVLMFKPTLPLWIHLPELRFVQFPWRWLLCLNVTVAIAIGLALRRWWTRGLVFAAAIGIVLVSWHAVLVPWWDSAADIQEMLDNQHDGIGNEGIDEYVPAGVDPYEVDQKAALAKFERSADAHIAVTSWGTECKAWDVNSNSRAAIVLRLFNYPLWHATVNGNQVRTESTETTGQMVIPIEAGENHIQITFKMGADRKLGIVLSVVSMFVLVFLFAMQRRSLARA
jgi:6-pyruvoyl-tetrahydropterin synthase related domain